jgi:starch phosphorylase
MFDIRTLPTADIELPPSLERLRDLAYDYWWSWSPVAGRLFSRIDPVAWRRYRNPVQLLINVEPQQWMRLLSDPEFERLYGETIASLDEYRAQPSWFEENAPQIRGPVAYFSM